MDYMSGQTAHTAGWQKQAMGSCVDVGTEGRLPQGCLRKLMGDWRECWSTEMGMLPKACDSAKHPHRTPECSSLTLYTVRCPRASGQRWISASALLRGLHYDITWPQNPHNKQLNSSLWFLEDSGSLKRKSAYEKWVASFTYPVITTMLHHMMLNQGIACWQNHRWQYLIM